VTVNPSSKTPQRGLRVGVYARYSSDRQSEHSIEDQLRICRAHVEREGWQFVRCFSDAAISGTTLQRPGLQALQLAMRAGEIDIILTEALDRLSRDQEHIAAIHKLAGYTGVRLVTLSEGEVGSIHVGLRGAMSAMYLEDLVAKTMRGIEGRIRAGRAMGAPPYGYRRVTSVLRPDVHRIFKCFAAGMTPAAIAVMLNKESVPAPERVGWSATTLRGRPSHGDGILRNRHYIGELVWNRRERVVDPMSGEAHRRLNPAEARIVGSVPELRIVDHPLWAVVQARLLASAAPQDPDTGRQRFWEKQRPRHLLSGKIFCGVCDAPFSSHRARQYCCNAATRGLCDNGTAIKREGLEARVLTILAEPVMDLELAEAFAAEFTAEWNRLAGQQSIAEGHIRRELEAAQRKLGNLLDAIAEGIRSSGLQAKLSAAEAEVDRLRHLVAISKPTPVRLMPNLGHAYRRTLERLREALNAGNNPEAVEAARALIERVIIHPTPRGTHRGSASKGTWRRC